MQEGSWDDDAGVIDELMHVFLDDLHDKCQKRFIADYNNRLLPVGTVEEWTARASQIDEYRSHHASFTDFSISWKSDPRYWEMTRETQDGNDAPQVMHCVKVSWLHAAGVIAEVPRGCYVVTFRMKLGRQNNGLQASINVGPIGTVTLDMNEKIRKFDEPRMGTASFHLDSEDGMVAMKALREDKSWRDVFVGVISMPATGEVQICFGGFNPSWTQDIWLDCVRLHPVQAVLEKTEKMSLLKALGFFFNEDKALMREKTEPPKSHDPNPGPLRDLRLCNSKDLTDGGSSNIGKLSQITHLHLDCCDKLTDKGVADLGNLQLDELKLAGCTLLTDASLKKIKVYGSLDVTGCTGMTGIGLLQYIQDHPTLRGVQVAWCKDLVALRAQATQHRLHKAVRNHETDMVEFLMAMKFCKESVDNHGETPCDTARRLYPDDVRLIALVADSKIHEMISGLKEVSPVAISTAAVVAALIVTLAYATLSSPPGSWDTETVEAADAQSSWFIAFAFFNMVALFSSLTALLLLLSLHYLQFLWRANPYKLKDDTKEIRQALENDFFAKQLQRGLVIIAVSALCLVGSSVVGPFIVFGHHEKYALWMLCVPAVCGCLAAFGTWRLFRSGLIGSRTLRFSSKV